jgi:Helix-turn-helix domain
VNVELPEAVVDELVELVAARVLERLEQPEPSPFLNVNEAAAHLRCRPQRVHDLLSAGRLSRFKEGARTLVARRELEALVTLERRAR